MAGYLRPWDYMVDIQPAILQQISTAQVDVITLAERRAYEVAREHLIQRYDLDTEMKPTTVWSNTKVYYASDLVELNFDAYSTTETYPVDSLVINAKKAYICTTAVTVPGAFNTGFWQLLGNQYDLFHVKYPELPFDSSAVYRVGDSVFYKNAVYTALQATNIYNPFDFPAYDMVPPMNVFPDDRVNGAAYWGAGVPYSITAGTLPTDTTIWDPTDNRSQSLVGAMVAVVLYKIHTRIAPMNVPPSKQKAYAEAMQWFKDATTGEITAQIEEKPPETGKRIRWGGSPKQINNY